MVNEVLINRIFFEDVKQYVNQNYRRRKKISKPILRCIYKSSEDGHYENIDLFTTSKSRKLVDLKDKLDETWQQALFNYIDIKEYRDPEVYKRASISKQTFSKIRSDINYQPNKDTAIQICIGLKLNIDESTDLLKKAGFALSKSIKRDLVVRYFIENEIYLMDDLNLVLNEMHLKIFPIN